MSIAESIVREIERAIEAAEFPSGMSVHDGKAKVDSSHLRRLLAELAALRAEAGRLRTGDTCARACEGMAFRIMYKQEKVRAEKAEAELAALRAELEQAKQLIANWEYSAAYDDLHARELANEKGGKWR